MSRDLPPLKKPPRRKLKPLDPGANAGSSALGVGIAIVGVAVAVGLVLLVLSNREEPEPSIPLDPSGASVEAERSPARPAVAQPPPSTLPPLIRYPSFYWSARVPSDGGWSLPQSTAQGALDRTEIRGPNGALAIIDFTPYQSPSPSNVISTAPANLPNNPGASVVRIQGGDLCPVGTTCTDYLLPIGDGGYAVLVGWPGKEQEAAQLARLMARSLIPTPGE